MKDKIKLIIPCAGFGTRVGSPESKEMMLSPMTGEPLINFALNHAKNFNWDVHVITRKEKKELINYLSKFPSVTIQIVEPTKEWPHSILLSEKFWNETNILILPDTYFEPASVLEDMASYLCCYEIVAGLIKMDDYRSWGVVNTTLKHYCIIEKPTFSFHKDYLAWGLLGFHKNVGKELFTKHLESNFDHQEKMISQPFKYIILNHFEDLTRPK